MRCKEQMAVLKERISKLQLLATMHGGRLEETDEQQLQKLLADFHKVTSWLPLLCRVACHDWERVKSDASQ